MPVLPGLHACTLQVTLSRLTDIAATDKGVTRKPRPRAATRLPLCAATIMHCSGVKSTNAAVRS
jgi:hypothetical protein